MVERNHPLHGAGLLLVIGLGCQIKFEMCCMLDKSSSCGL